MDAIRDDMVGYNKEIRKGNYNFSSLPSKIGSVKTSLLPSPEKPGPFLLRFVLLEGGERLNGSLSR